MKDGEYMHKPCVECPFTRGPKAVRLRRGRVKQLTDLMLGRGSGGEFACHKTVKDQDRDDAEDDGMVYGGESRHCAGAVIFALKNGKSTQMMRIAQRLGLFRPNELQGQDQVFDTAAEMMATALDAPGQKKARAR